MKVVRLSAIRTGRLYPQETFLVLISLRISVDYVNEKNPMTPSGIELATFWLVAQWPQPTAPPRAPVNAVYDVKFRDVVEVTSVRLCIA